MRSSKRVTAAEHINAAYCSFLVNEAPTDRHRAVGASQAVCLQVQSAAAPTLVSEITSPSRRVVSHGAQAGVPCLEVFIARGPEGELLGSVLANAVRSRSVASFCTASPCNSCRGAQAGVPCLEVFIARGPDGELRQQASVLRPTAAKAPARMDSSTDVEEALAAGALPLPGHPSLIPVVMSFALLSVLAREAGRLWAGRTEAGSPGSTSCVDSAGGHWCRSFYAGPRRILLAAICTIVAAQRQASSMQLPCLFFGRPDN